MEQSPTTPHEPSVHVTTNDSGGAEVRVSGDPITRPELEARFREIKTRIWIVAASSFMGSVLGGSLAQRAGLTPHTAAAIVGRLIS